MPRARLSNVSLKQLVSELNRRKSRLSALLAQQEAIAEEIEALQELGVEVAAPRNKPGRKPGRKPGPKRATGKPLAQYVKEALAAAPKGLSINEIEAKVRQAGYPTKAAKLYNPIFAVVSKGFKKVEKGVYALKSAGKAAVAAAKARPAATARGRKKRGVFKETGEEMIVRLLKVRPMTTAEITAAWEKAGRGGKADNALGRLVKGGQIKRKKLAEGKGSTYSVA